VTFALLPFSWKSVLAFGKGATEWLAAVLSTETRRTRALAATFGAVGELKTGKVIEIAVETWWAVRWSVAKDGGIGIGCEEVVCADE